MCHSSVLRFVQGFADYFPAARVLEVGSYNVNGSCRPDVEWRSPSLYIGVDMREGPGVDRVVPAENLTTEFGEESFDIVIATELLEHVEDWRSALTNMANVLRTDGLLIITTRSPGFPLHEFPGDYWRYTVYDFVRIFQTWDIITAVPDPDPESPGVFFAAKRPALGPLYLYFDVLAV